LLADNVSNFGNGRLVRLEIRLEGSLGLFEEFFLFILMCLLLLSKLIHIQSLCNYIVPSSRVIIARWCKLGLLLLLYKCLFELTHSFVNITWKKVIVLVVVVTFHFIISSTFIIICFLHHLVHFIQFVLVLDWLEGISSLVTVSVLFFLFLFIDLRFSVALKIIWPIKFIFICRIVCFSCITVLLLGLQLSRILLQCWLQGRNRIRILLSGGVVCTGLLSSLITGPLVELIIV